MTSGEATAIFQMVSSQIANKLVLAQGCLLEGLALKTCLFKMWYGTYVKGGERHYRHKIIL